MYCPQDFQMARTFVPVIIVSGIRSEQDLENIQAQAKRVNECSIKRTQSDTQVILTCPNSCTYKCQFFCHYRKKSITQEMLHYEIVQENVSHNVNCQKLASLSNLVSQSQKNFPMRKPTLGSPPSTHSLVNLDDINLLKKEIQFRSKGMLSKSTQFNQQKDLITCIRLKCKNFPIEICPFKHIFQYKCTMDGKPYYQSRNICDYHISECWLNTQEMQENLITRKIDISHEILQKIIGQNPEAKPKIILQILAQELGEQNQNFLYEGLIQKNIKRSMKKYFDNTVAKIKNKIRVQST